MRERGREGGRKREGGRGRERGGEGGNTAMCSLSVYLPFKSNKCLERERECESSARQLVRQ